jgi:DNA-binding PadR family transcriptional regulator
VPKRRVNNLLALAVLAYLTQRPMHPYELSRTLRDNGDARSIKFTHGSLYMVVRQLAGAGFVVEQETSRAGQRPERTIYALTETGRHELRDWLRELVEQPQHEYPHFVAALSLIGALPPDVVLRALQVRLERLTGLRAEAQQVIDAGRAADVHPLFLVEEDYRLEVLAAETRFVERFIQHISDPQTGWGPMWAAHHAQPPGPAEVRGE